MYGKVKCQVNRITNLNLKCKTDAQTRYDHRAVFSVHKGYQINIWSETKKVVITHKNTFDSKSVYRMDCHG